MCGPDRAEVVGVPPGGRRGQVLASARDSRRHSRRRSRPPGRARRLATGAGGIWRSLRRRSRYAILGSAAVLAAAAVAAALLLSRSPAPRARQYLAFTACLLTGPAGLADAQAAQAWAGLQQASLATRAKVQYLPVESGTTAAAATPYLASLTTRHCRVVVAVGGAQVSAVTAAAHRYRSVQFAVIGGASAGPNVTVVTGGAAHVRAVIDSLVTTAVAHSGTA
jgi:hypothetical protein